MKLCDLASRVVVDPRTLVAYALNPDAPQGRHKAHVLAQVLGYTREHYEGLLAQIAAQAADAEARFHSQDAYGHRYTADFQIDGPAGQQAIVRTGWFVPEGADAIRLVTLWVKR